MYTYMYIYMYVYIYIYIYIPYLMNHIIIQYKFLAFINLRKCIKSIFNYSNCLQLVSKELGNIGNF